jgi:hypothetical protein
MDQLDFERLTHEKFRLNLDCQMRAVEGTKKDGETGKLNI